MREHIIIYYPFHVPPMHYYAHYCSCAAGFTGTRCQFKSIPLDILYGNGPEKGINFCTYLYSYIVHSLEPFRTRPIYRTTQRSSNAWCMVTIAWLQVSATMCQHVKPILFKIGSIIHEQLPVHVSTCILYNLRHFKPCHSMILNFSGYCSIW